MSDLEAALASVRAELDVVGGRREEIDRRRKELDRQYADLDRQYDELAVTLKVMERHASGTAGSSATDEAAGEGSLTDRVLDAIVELRAPTRAELRRKFVLLGVNENSMDSAVLRLVKRGSVRREGRRLVPLVVPSEPGSPGPVPGSVSDGSEVDPRPANTAPDPVDGDREPQRGPGGASNAGDRPASGDRPAGDVDARPLTVRILEALGSSGGLTRRALLQHFGPQGVKDRSISDALTNLRKRGKVERGGRRLWVVPGQNPPSAPAGAASRS